MIKHLYRASEFWIGISIGFLVMNFQIQNVAWMLWWFFVLIIWVGVFLLERRRQKYARQLYRLLEDIDEP